MKKNAKQSTRIQTSISVRVSLWKNEREINLTFPPEWDVVECKMAGHDLPPLTPAEITRAFENPIGSDGIRALAKGKQKIFILDVATSHTVGAAMSGDEIAGFFEYHTVDITLGRLEAELKQGYHFLHIVAHGMFKRKAVLFLADDHHQVRKSVHV